MCPPTTSSRLPPPGNDPVRCSGRRSSFEATNKRTHSFHSTGGGKDVLRCFSETGSRMRQKECVVTGAGVAGLAAAYRLSQRNWEVTVLEATDRVGGRVGAYHSDGAPEHKEMRRLCSRLSLPLQKHQYANSFWNQTARASLSAPGSWCMSPKSDAIWKNFQKKFRTSTPHQWRQLDKIDYSNGRHYGFRSIGPTESGYGPCTV